MGALLPRRDTKKALAYRSYWMGGGVASVLANMGKARSVFSLKCLTKTDPEQLGGPVPISRIQRPRKTEANAATFSVEM